MLAAYRAALPAAALFCSTVAFILAMCCLLAGTNPSTLPNMQLYTLNTSRISETFQKDLGLPPPDPSFNFSTMLPRDIGDDITNAGKKVEDKGDNLASNAADAIKDPSAAIKNLKANITDTVNDGKKAIEDAGTKLKDGLKNATAEIVSTFINETISTLNIEDFYLAHLMTYCSGRYTKTSSQNITFCSNHKPNHKYNVSTSTTTANSSHTADDPFAFITNLHFPDPVDFAMKAITLLSKIIAALYIVALILVFLSLLTSALTIPPTSKSNMLRYATLASALGAFLSLLLGTILVHFLCKKLCGFFEAHKGLGVQARRGENWMGCSIAGTVFMGIVVLCALLDVAVGRVVGKGSDKLTGMVEKRLPFGLGRKGGKGGKEFAMEERR